MSSFCKNCGEQIEGGKFCTACGAPVDGSSGQITNEQPRAEQSMSGRVSPSGEIIQGPDGVFRWAYDFNMLTNPTILFTIFKVIGISFGLVWVFEVGINIFADGFDFSELLGITKGFFIIFVGIMILIAISYWLYALIALGGKYCVLFEMNEKGITHTQAPKQFKKAQVVALITGLTANNLSTLGNALIVGSRSSISSEWSKVRSVQCFPGRGVIKVNELLNKNQVYTSKEDFEFVRDYILSHCVNAKIK